MCVHTKCNTSYIQDFLEQREEILRDDSTRQNKMKIKNDEIVFHAFSGY